MVRAKDQEFLKVALFTLMKSIEIHFPGAAIR